MFASLFGSIINVITGNLINRIEDGFKAYLAGQVTKAQLQEKLQEAMLGTFAEVEKSYADSIARSYGSFIEAAGRSKVMQDVWAMVCLCQLFVLFWYQWVVPFMVTEHWIDRWAPAGTTVDWAYAIVLFCLGGGALAQRTGPSAGSVMSEVKALVK